jgi:hypothetical protein
MYTAPAAQRRRPQLTATRTALEPQQRRGLTDRATHRGVADIPSIAKPANHYGETRASTVIHGFHRNQMLDRLYYFGDSSDSRRTR